MIIPIWCEHMRRFIWRQWPLAVKLTLIITTVVVMAVAGVAILSIQREQQSYQSELQGQAKLLLNSLSAATSDRLYYLDQSYLNVIMKSLGEDQIVLAGRVYDGKGRVVADAYDSQAIYNPQADPLGQLLLQSDTTVFEWQPDRLVAGHVVIAGRDRLGAISIALSTTPLQAKMDAVRNQGIGVGLGAALLGALMALLVSRSITRPLRVLIDATERIARGDLTQTIAVGSGDELAVLGSAFNGMTTQLQHLIASVEQRSVEQRRLQEEMIHMQAGRLRELSAPLIQIGDRVVAMPLIGAVDAQSIEQALDTLLKGVTTHRAQLAILDITGVPVMDTQAAHGLLQVAQAVRLLGTQLVITGIRAEVAQSLIDQGIDLKGIVTRRTLQEGLAFVAAQR
jgi:anti-anti-sigma regulatory factor/HAMP domain-containing protein